MKKIIALVLSIVLTIGLASVVSANIQLPVDSVNVTNVHYVLGENIITGEPIINPTMTVGWDNPAQWANDTEIHDPDYYEMVVNNISFNETNTITINDGSQEFTDQSVDVHDELNLKTGSLYQLAVYPYHYHTVDVGGTPTQQLAPNSPGAEIAYALTDLNVEFISDEESIQVIWDDIGIPDFEYRIVYALGDYSSRTKQDILNNAEGEILGITSDSDDVDTFFDQVEQRNKLSYTIDESIYPGQVYSIMVEPITEYYNGELIVRNRNYPFIKSVSTNVQLSLVEEGDYIRLQWEIPASFRVGQSQDEYALVEATLMEYQDGLGRTLVIFDGDAASIGYYRVQKPIWETEYELRLTYRAVDDGSKPPIQPISNRLTFVPSEYLIQPTKPYVPKVLTEATLEDLRASMTLNEIREELRDNYLVRGYNYTGALDDIFDEGVTFHSDNTLSAINFVWSAFERIDVDVTSPTYNNLITDTNVYYDIWVTDELSTLAYATPILLNERYTQTTDPHVIVDSTNDIVGFRQTLSFYYDTEQGIIEEISPDQLYYIKVQAKKVTAQGTLVSEPTITSIYFSYEGSSFEPPTIAKPPLKIKDDETTEDSLTINWRESWYEVISPDPGIVHPHVLANWQHEIWMAPDGTMYNEPMDGTEYYAIYDGQSEVQRFKDDVDVILGPLEILDRRVTLGLDDFGVSDVQYKFYMLPYNLVLEEIATRQNVEPTFSFEEYYNELIDGDRDGTAPIGWQDIIPYVDMDDEYSLSYEVGGLDANTSYLMIVMPYRELRTGEILYSHYPTPIIGSTSPEEDVVVPNPTVPTLYVTNQTDTEVTVTWKYNIDFEYELVYGRLEDVDEATSVIIELSENILDPNYPRDGEYFDVVVDDLFPLTTYYFWIRAIQTSNSTTSLWSNPAIGNTLDTEAPIPPRGVGLAPLSRIEDYGYTDSVSDNFIIVEWIRDTYDYEDEDEGDVVKNYSYIIEIADNAKFIDPIYVESSGGSEDVVPDDVEILEKNLIKVNDLVPNRQYFVRVKTRVRVVGPEEGQLIVKDSPSYSEPIRVITLSSGSEYDGFEDPALSILPSRDYELIYDDNDNMLVFRFRDDSVDGSGASDNNVDQRLISDLIADNVHEYVIDVNGYKNKNVEMRRIAIPYSIIEAFATHQVDMKIMADEMTLDLPSNAIIKQVQDQVLAYGVAPMVIIDINELDIKHTIDLIDVDGLSSVATPQELSIEVRSTRKTDYIGYTNALMTVGLKTTSRYEVYDQDTLLYVQDASAKWKTTEGTYDKYEGRMMFETADVGVYGLYVIDKETAIEQNTTQSHWSESYRMDVYSQIQVNGINVYNANNYASEKNVVQAVYGTAMASPTIDLSATLTSKDMTTLTRSGLKNDTNQTDGTITREEVIAMFVRAYEIRNGVFVDVNEATYKTVVNNSNISTEYKTAIAKAHNIGMISSVSGLRPKDAITYGEMFVIWSSALD